MNNSRLRFRSKLTWISALCVVLTSATSSAEEKVQLPRDIAEMLEKFESYERQERSQVESRISDKRKAVTAYFVSAVQREVKKGNLEEAVAIKGLIVKLERSSIPTTSNKENEETSQRQSETDALSEKGPVRPELHGTKWRNQFTNGVLDLTTKPYRVFHESTSREVSVELTDEAFVFKGKTFSIKKEKAYDENELHVWTLVE